MKREEQIRLARQLLESGVLSEESTNAIRADFPELAESEDERIRKEIIEYLANRDYDIEDTWIPWLKKQKEQSFTHHEIDESLHDAVTHQMEDDGDVDDFVRKGIDDIALKYAMLGAEWQKEQKPNIELIQRSWYMEGYHDREFCREPKWVIKTGEGGPRYEKNEKYEQPLEQNPTEWSEEDEKMLWSVINGLNQHVYEKERNWLANRLKSLRPQPRWKPSEEQMCELNWASKLSPVLESLYNDLKKL